MNLKLASIALISLSVLASCGDKGKQTNNAPATPAAATNSETKSEAIGGKFAYVNADTLNKHYLYLKEKKAAFEKKQTAYENEMAGKEKALQNEYVGFQKKAQDGNLTPSEIEAAQKRLASQQQALEKRHQTISAEIAKEQLAIQDEFQNRLDTFLENFNKEKGFDFIFTYSKDGGAILFANKSLDITQQVLDVMNEDYKNGSKSTSVTESK